MTQAAAEELETLLREQQEEEAEAARKAAEAAEDDPDKDKGNEGAADPDKDKGGDEGDEPKSADIKKQLFEKAGLDPETEEPVQPAAKPAEDKPIEGQTDEDVKDLPEKLTADNRKIFIEERIKARKQREADAQERDREAQRQAEAEKNKAAAGGADERGKGAEGAQGQITESEYLTAISWASQAQSVLDGNYRDDLPEDKAKEVLKAANTVLAQIADPTMLARLRGKIMTGQVPDGVDMRSALEVLDKEMPFVQARAGELERMAREHSQARAQMASGFKDALKVAYEQFPEFKPPVKGAKGSAEHEFAVKTMKELSEAEIHALYADPKAQLPKIMRRIKAEFMFDKNEQLAAENAALKKRIEKGKLPMPGGGSGGGSREQSTGEATSADIKKKLEEKTGLTL